jgi:hypothetical protein
VQEVQYLRIILFWDFYLKLKRMDIILDNFLLLVVKNRILYDIMKKANTYLYTDNLSIGGGII